MSLEEDILIERFLRNELSKEEHASFLKKVDNDSSFKELYFFEKELFESLNQESWSNISVEQQTKEIKKYDNLFNDEKTEKLKQEIKNILQKQKEKNKSKGQILKLFYSTAAVVILLIAINFFFFNKTYSTEQLYAEYIQKEKLLSFRVRGENELEKELILAEKKFRNNKFTEAIKLFNTELEKDKNYSLLYIYKAISHIELKEYDEAENILDKLISNNDLLDAEKGFWYKSLLYIKSNQISKAKNILNKIVENSYFKNKEAKELLSKIED